MKITHSTANPIKQPQTRGADQGSVEPPHCSPRNRHTRLAVRIAALAKSRRPIFSLRGKSESLPGFRCRMKITITAAIKPKAITNVSLECPPFSLSWIGYHLRRLIQKQKRQVNRESVSNPPTVGPASVAIEYNPVIIAIPRGLFRSGTTCPKIAKFPVNIPAAAAPAMARPRMRMGELGATAQITEPTSKVSNDSRNIIFASK